MDQELLDHWCQDQVKGFQFCIHFNAQDNGSAMFFVIVKWCNLIHAHNAQTSSISCKTCRCPISNMTSPNPTYRFRNVWTRSPLLEKPIQKLWGRNSSYNPPHHSPYSRTTCIPGGVSGRSTRISRQSRWGTCPWIIITTSSPQGGGPPRITRILRSYL